LFYQLSVFIYCVHIFSTIGDTGDTGAIGGQLALSILLFWQPAIFILTVVLCFMSIYALEMVNKMMMMMMSKEHFRLERFHRQVTPSAVLKILVAFTGTLNLLTHFHYNFSCNILVCIYFVHISFHFCEEIVSCISFSSPTPTSHDRPIYMTRCHLMA